MYISLLNNRSKRRDEILLSHYSVFFFSSRRRHTRCGRDWSSDVCSSDLSKSMPWAAAMASTPTMTAVLRAISPRRRARSEEHTSELPSRPHLGCRLLLEKKQQNSCEHRHRGTDTPASWPLQARRTVAPDL